MNIIVLNPHPCFNVKNLCKVDMCMRFEVLKKVVSKLLSRVKASEDFLKFICMMKSSSLWVLELGKVQDNKALHRRYIKGYKEHSTSKWSCTRVYIKMMKNMTLRRNFKMEFKMLQVYISRTTYCRSYAITGGS